MELVKTAEIDIWGGDWGLPSVDFESLRLLTLLTLAKHDVKVNKTSNPFWAPNGTLPVVRLKNKTITSFEDLMSYLNSKNINPDYGLTNLQLAETEAYTHMLKEKLYPALKFVWWLDRVNHNKVTNPLYCKLLPFPFNFVYPKRFVNEAREMVESMYDHMEDEKDIENKIISEAEKCLTALSVRLNDSDYMFGAHPRSIDVTIFSYLAPLLKAPFSSVVLQNHLKACTNLQKLVTRMNKQYFLQDFEDYELKKKTEMKKEQETKVDFPNKTRNQIFAGFFAVLAMICYAYNKGIVQSPVDSNGFEDETVFEAEDFNDDG